MFDKAAVIEPAIKVNGLSRRFGDLTAVDDISFQVAQGEIFGFLGPNGAGKTTTVRMLTGVIEPTNGSATIQGHNIREESILSREHIAVVPEQANVSTFPSGETLCSWLSFLRCSPGQADHLRGKVVGNPWASESKRQ